MFNFVFVCLFYWGFYITDRSYSIIWISCFHYGYIENPPQNPIILYHFIPQCYLFTICSPYNCAKVDPIDKICLSTFLRWWLQLYTIDQLSRFFILRYLWLIPTLPIEIIIIIDSYHEKYYKFNSPAKLCNNCAFRAKSMKLAMRDLHVICFKMRNVHIFVCGYFLLFLAISAKNG